MSAQAARYLDASAQSLTLNGGATFMDGELRATRTVTDSFATVEVGGVADVTVYYDNQPVAHTDANGIAVVRDLRSYDVNRLSIDPLQLPLGRLQAQARRWNSGSGGRDRHSAG